MFYSEALLSKKGPLARVWLAANLERKLSKAQFLQTSIEKSVGAIVGADVAPMALRLSGQLLLGVVRIYSRKAKYLLDDCNEALMKLRMTFSRGNVDLVSSATAANPQVLTLPNTITELDLFFNDADVPLDLGIDELITTTGRGAHTSNLKDITLPELQDSIELGRGEVGVDELAFMGDDDLVLDTGEYIDIVPEEPRAENADDEFDPHDDRYNADADVPNDYYPEQSIEIGRDAVNVDAMDDFGADLVDTSLHPPSGEDGQVAEADKSLHFEDGEMMELDIPSIVHDDAPFSPPLVPAATATDKTAPRKRAAPIRKLKIDDVTELKSAFIKDMQENRTGILRVYATLPYEREEVTLLSMYESAGIIDILGKSANIHSSLASALKPTYVADSSFRKRKTAEVEIELRESPKRVNLGLEGQEEVQPYEPYEDNEIIDFDERMEPVAADYMPAGMDIEELNLDVDFEDGVAVKETGDFTPEENQESADANISSTQNAGEILQSTRKIVSVLQQELSETDKVDFQTLTANSTRKQAVEFFFETLVLATKDVLQIQQANPYGLIDIRAKERLFTEDWTSSAPEPSQVPASA
ncbi:Rec8 like protein-domain-containing protein [Limtongia smithiae]|uniref:Rec8 like protein-domain-containing protein n=1 Tax=Limtongia smithiae TaxID=1125753 RepID=UPI0034CF5B3A